MIERIRKALSGHIKIGKRITIYGRNAMRWGVTIWTNRYGYICFRLPFTCFGKWFPLYLYFSPNATPWAATLMLGKTDNERAKSKLRKSALGHNFMYDSENNCDNWNTLMTISDTLG